MWGLRDRRVMACVCLVFPADAQETEAVIPPARTGHVCAMWPWGPRGFAAPVTCRELWEGPAKGLFAPIAGWVVGWGLGEPPSMGQGAQGSSKMLGDMPVAASLKAAAVKGFSNGILGGRYSRSCRWSGGEGELQLRDSSAQGQGNGPCSPRESSPPHPRHHGGKDSPSPWRAGPQPWGLLPVPAQAFPLGVIRDNYNFISPAASLQEAMQD